MQQWMNSSGHRANILTSRFDEIGVGYGKGTITQEERQRRGHDDRLRLEGRLTELAAVQPSGRGRHGAIFGLPRG